MLSNFTNDRYVMREMEWTKTHGRWQGEWKWKSYDRAADWDEKAQPKVNRRWRDMGKRMLGLSMTLQSTTASIAGDVPQEVLLGMVHQLEYVSTFTHCLCAFPHVGCRCRHSYLRA